jgi:LEA14-like dessication related protein
MTAGALRRLAIAGIACVLAACAAPMARIESPALVAATVRVVALSFPMIRLAVDLVVRNPNAIDLVVEVVDLRVDIEGGTVARSALLQPATLPAGRESILRFDASGDLGAALAGVARALEARGAPLRYAIRGEARLRNGVVLPFVRSGELAWR